MATKFKFGARHQAYRVEKSDVATSQLLRTPVLGIHRVLGTGQVPQMRYCRQHQQAQRSDALLPVDDFEGSVVGRL